jgi:hypothetical protein
MPFADVFSSFAERNHEISLEKCACLWYFKQRNVDYSSGEAFSPVIKPGGFSS